jgi:hypothetical protein
MTQPHNDGVTLPNRSGADRCAPAAQRRGDPPAASAAPGNRWLLIEDQGPWSEHAFQRSATLRLLARRAAALGGRAALIRRPGGRVPRPGEHPPPRRWALVDARPGHEQVWWSTYTDQAELLRVPLDPPPVPPSGEPVYLVCTQGRHDACCAIRGRPVAAALARRHPDRTWECSHVGGCRFSANLVLLPHGLVYAHVTPDTAAELVADYAAGRVRPANLRGRSALPGPVQAAQHEARRQTGELAVDAFRPLSSESAGPDSWLVRLAFAGGELSVLVRCEWAAPQLLTCRATAPDRTRRCTAEVVEPAAAR